MSRAVRITILRREYYQDLADRFLTDPHAGPCALFREGQQFLVTRENYDAFPCEGRFCPAAWDVIKHKVYSSLQGGRFYWEGWSRDARQQILCCDDGVRPVVFLLEQLETGVD